MYLRHIIIESLNQNNNIDYLKFSWDNDNYLITDKVTNKISSSQNIFWWNIIYNFENCKIEAIKDSVPKFKKLAENEIEIGIEHIWISSKNEWGELIVYNFITPEWFYIKEDDVKYLW